MKRADKKIAADVAEKNQYHKYFKEMRAKNKQPMTFSNWKTGGRGQGYYDTKGSTSAGARLSRSDRKAIGMKD